MSSISVSTNALSSSTIDSDFDIVQSHEYKDQLMADIQTEKQKADSLKQEIVEIYQDRIKKLQIDLDKEKEKSRGTLVELQKEKIITQNLRQENNETKEWAQKEFKILKNQIDDLSECIKILKTEPEKIPNLKNINNNILDNNSDDNSKELLIINFDTKSIRIPNWIIRKGCVDDGHFNDIVFVDINSGLVAYNYEDALSHEINEKTLIVIGTWDNESQDYFELTNESVKYAVKLGLKYRSKHDSRMSDYSDLFGTWKFNEYTMTIIANDSDFDLVFGHPENNKRKPSLIHWTGGKLYWTIFKGGIHTTDSSFCYDPSDPNKITEINSGCKNTFIRVSN